MTLELLLEETCAIDDARQPIGEHAECRRHSGQQEHRSDRRLDQVGDVYQVAPFILLSPASPRGPAGCGAFFTTNAWRQAHRGPHAAAAIAAAALAAAALLAVRSFNKVLTPSWTLPRCTPPRSAVSPALRPPTRT